MKAGRSVEKSEKDDKSEREKRDELSKKLERRREELNAIPVNNLTGTSTRTVKTQEAAPASNDPKETKDAKAKEKK